MKLIALLFLLLPLSICIAIPPEKSHQSVIPFLDLKEALLVDFNKSPYFISIINELTQINSNDTLSFEVTIPETWKNREIFIGFEGEDLNFSFHVNDQFIDIAPDTLNTVEWRLNRIAKVGVNKLKFKSLQGKNNLYQAYLYTTPKLLISNYNVVSNLDLSGVNGILDIIGEVRNLDKRDYYKYTIEFALYDQDNKLVFSEKSPAFSFGKSKNKTKGINYSRNLMNITPWTLSDPYLYKLIINMRDGDDNSELEILSKKIAFSNQKISDGHLILNNIQRPFNAIKFTSKSIFSNQDTLASIIHRLKMSHTNIAVIPRYIPQIWKDKCLQNGLITLPDTNAVYSNLADSSFKLLEIDWLDSSKKTIKIKNYNLESKKGTLVFQWKLTNEAKTLLSGNATIELPIGNEKIWELPESLDKIKNKQGCKLTITFKSLKSSFWHSKNFIFFEKELEI